MELYVNFDTISQYPDKQQQLIQCITRVSDMLISSRNKVISFFTEDIANFFEDNLVLFTESASFIGKSGRNITFDFILPKSKRATPKLIQAINNPRASQYKDPLLSFLDVEETKSDYDFYVIANDENDKMSAKFVEALENHQIIVLLWSHRNKWVEEMKAI